MAQIWHLLWLWLWLWCRPAAIDPIRPLTWELPNTPGAALKRPKKKKGERIAAQFIGIYSRAIMPHVDKDRPGT